MIKSIYKKGENVKEFELKNNIKCVYKQNKNTPRIAVCFDIEITKPAKIPGIYSMVNRLLLQGTKNRTAEELTNEVDENAIEISGEGKRDYLKFSLLCLNEDFEHGLEILQDIIENSTFDDTEKEKIKTEGELTASLDSANVRAQDNFAKTLYKGHFYGDTYTRLLENLDKINKDNVKDAYNDIMKFGAKHLAVVGDIDFETTEKLLNKYLGDISNENIRENEIPTPSLDKSETVEYIKDDANQAQIYQGWLVPTYKSEDYAPLLVLTTILGASGLSSRLFTELRDKKGLAYTVRSIYEPFRTAASFQIYIATEPKNIQTALAGFKEEIQKIKDVLVPEEELHNAKNNYIGKRQYLAETNIQQAGTLVHFANYGLGFNYQDKVIEQVKHVTAQQVQDVARNYLNEVSVISILRP